MTGLGLVVAWAGYTLMFYGWNFARGAPITIGDTAYPKRRKFLIEALANKGQALTRTQ